MLVVPNGGFPSSRTLLIMQSAFGSQPCLPHFELQYYKDLTLKSRLLLETLCTKPYDSKRCRQGGPLEDEGGALLICILCPIPCAGTLHPHCCIPLKYYVSWSKTYTLRNYPRTLVAAPRRRRKLHNPGLANLTKRWLLPEVAGSNHRNCRQHESAPRNPKQFP